MSKLLEQLEEDRQLRNAARKVLRKEVDYVREEYTPSAIGRRLAGKVSGRISEAGEQTGEFARRNAPTAAIAALAAAGAFGLWMMRRPIISGLADYAGRCKEMLQGPKDETPNEDAEA